MIPIRYNYDSNIVRRDMPTAAIDIIYATVRITTNGGSELEASAETDIWGCVTNVAVVTLATATDAGDYQITLSMSTETRDLYPGDLIRVGNSTGVYEDVRVRAWDATSSVVTLDDYLRTDHAAGEVVVGRWTSCTVDTTTTASWPVNQRIVFEWVFADATSKGSTWLASDEGEVVRYEPGYAGLGEKFRARYRRYYDTIESGDWTQWERDARQTMEDMFAARGKDVTHLVDASRLDELHMAQIALMVAYAGGDEWDQERSAMAQIRNEIFERLCSLSIWSDTDQDHIETDEETQTAQRPMPRRRLW